MRGLGWVHNRRHDRVAQKHEDSLVFLSVDDKRWRITSDGMSILCPSRPCHHFDAGIETVST